MAKKLKYKNVPHSDPLRDRLPAETLAELHRMKESPETQSRPVVDRRVVNTTS